MFAFIRFVPYILVAIFVGAFALVFSQWQHEKERREYFQSIQESNVSYAGKKDFNNAIDSFGLSIKNRNVEEVSRIVTTTTNNVITTIKDSVSGTNNLRCIDWSNNYSSLKGCFETGVEMTHKDTLDVVLHRKPTKKFLFIKYAKKDTLEIFNKDPSSKYNIRSFRRKK